MVELYELCVAKGRLWSVQATVRSDYQMKEISNTVCSLRFVYHRLWSLFYFDFWYFSLFLFQFSDNDMNSFSFT